MRVDHDLVRDMLPKVGEMPFDGAFHEIQIEGRTEKEVSHHVMQVANAGPIEGVDLSARFLAV